jgi:hypothetical protein
MERNMEINYTEDYLRELIETQAEESIHLDFKASGALEKNDVKRTEIAKDVSAFANSDGGIIIYGILEKNHVANEISYIDGNIYTKEWIERIINNGIQRRIDGIEIFPIRIEGDIKKSVYVVKIPRSSNAPHMCVSKHQYYRRFNFESVPMEEYEVRDTFFRESTPKLEILGIKFGIVKETETEILYSLSASIGNYGHQVCESYKLNFYINNPVICDVSYQPLEEKHSFTIMNKDRLKLSSPAQESIYPDEMLDLGHFQISVKKENKEVFEKGLVIDMILYFSNLTDELAYVYSEDRLVNNREEIKKIVEERKVRI